MSKEYDFVVIGGGSAGYAAARTAAAGGLSVAVVEGGAEVGGLCILRGCMPSKTLIESSNRFETLRRAHEFGLHAENIAFSGKEIIARKQRLVREFSEYRREQLEDGRFDFIRGLASFVDPHTLKIISAENETSLLKGKSFLISTGSREKIITVPGLTETGYLDSDAVLESENIPESVVILGGGAIAMEFAHYYAGLGTKVAIIQRGGQVLKGMDGDMAGSLVNAFTKRGIDVYLNTVLLKVAPQDEKKRVWFKQDGTEKCVEASEIVCATGRVPQLEGLNIENAGVVAKDDCLTSRPGQQTNVPHIFAAGDVSSPHEIVHVAIQQGEIAARNAARLIRGNAEPFEEIDYRLKMFVVFSEPQVANVGKTEQELVKEGTPHAVARYPFDDHGKSMVMGETDGFVKLIASTVTGEILGGAVVGPHASDLIHEIAVAMYFKATAADLARIPHYHPTLSEIWTYPAEDLAMT